MREQPKKRLRAFATRRFSTSSPEKADLDIGGVKSGQTTLTIAKKL